MSKHRYNANREVAAKSDATIERETAKKWAARAVACHARYKKTGRIAWLTRAKGYTDEALEHAALVRDNGKLVREIERMLKEIS